jgi:hypothetical protein
MVGTSSKLVWLVAMLCTHGIREVTGSALATCGGAEERAHGCRTETHDPPSQIGLTVFLFGAATAMLIASLKLRQRREGVAKVGRRV